jgi:hypothetical protein
VDHNRRTTIDEKESDGADNSSRPGQPARLSKSSGIRSRAKSCSPGCRNFADRKMFTRPL